jgi:hypothetical protein
LYVARHTEFIVRRCFFPYALLFFALFNIMNVAFVLSAIGANLVWPVALYSSQALLGARVRRQEFLLLPQKPAPGCVDTYQLDLRGSLDSTVVLRECLPATQHRRGRFGFLN